MDLQENTSITIAFCIKISWNNSKQSFFQDMDILFNMDTFAVLVVLCLVLLFFIFNNWKLKRTRGGKIIPTVKGLPFIGNAHQMQPNQTTQLCQWSEQFGKIYQLNLAGKKQPQLDSSILLTLAECVVNDPYCTYKSFDSLRVIVISEAKLGKEVFSHPSSTGKPIFTAITLHEDQHKPVLGIAFSDGEIWETNRRNLVRHLRSFAIDKTAMEKLISNELDKVLNNLKMIQGTPITELDALFRLPVVNSLWTILTSKRFEHDDLEFIHIARDGMSSFNEIISSGVLLFMPCLRKIFPNWTGYAKLRRIQDRLIATYAGIIQEHKESFHDSRSRDFIDVYLSEIKRGYTGPHFQGLLADRQLETILNDTFFAGSDSTVNTLSWSILYLCKFPDIQCKLQAEIDNITNHNSRKPCLEDRKMMPYSQALIDEILRHSSVLSDGATHRVVDDFQIDDYMFPKNSWIQLNLYYIHHDPKIWGDNANEFHPERFLSKNSDDSWAYHKNSNLLPFQVGRRSCIGEALARDTLFLYITNIFQRFNVAFVGSEFAQPSMFDSVPGLTRSPKPFTFRLSPRN